MFPSNEIKTSKYSIITFLPKNLFEQFQRLSNVYFLLIMIISLIPGLSPISPVTAIIPLVFVLSITGIREAWEDAVCDYFVYKYQKKRHRSDKRVNSRKALRWNGEQFELVPWKDLRVGNIIKIEGDNPIPADILILSTSRSDGRVAVDTSALDGETGARWRTAFPTTSSMTSSTDLQKLKETSSYIVTDAPSPELHLFSGQLRIFYDPSNVRRGRVDPLNLEQTLWRGFKLKAKPDEWIIGVIIFTGSETRELMNAKQPRFKLSSFEVQLNRLLLLLFAFLAAIIIVSSILSVVYI